MGFQPFLNVDGYRQVRWGRLALLWIVVVIACSLPTALVSQVLVGEWRYFLFDGAGLGIAFCAGITALGFALPVEELPTC